MAALVEKVVVRPDFGRPEQLTPVVEDALFGCGDAIAATSTPEGGDPSMKTIKTLFLVLGVCSIFSKAAIHTYRHFYPPAPVAVGP